MSKIALIPPAFPHRANLTKFVNITMVGIGGTHTIVNPSEIFLRKDNRFTISSRTMPETSLIGRDAWRLGSRFVKFIGMLPNGTTEDITFQ